MNLSFLLREQDLEQTEGRPYWIKVHDGFYLLVEKVDRAPGALIDFSLAIRRFRTNSVNESGPGITVREWCTPYLAETKFIFLSGNESVHRNVPARQNRRTKTNSAFSGL